MSTGQPAAPKAELWKSLLTLLVTLLVGGAFCVVVLEIYVRQQPASAWEMPQDAFVNNDGKTPFIFTGRMRPNLSYDFQLLDGGSYHVDTNAQGFRSAPVADLEGADLSVVSIGDSFTFGWGVKPPERMMDLLIADYQRAHPDRKIGHAVVATPGWDPRDYYFAYLLEVLPVQPDVVVLGFFAGNDIIAPDVAKVDNPKDAAKLGLMGWPEKEFWQFPDWTKNKLAGNLTVGRIALKLGYQPKNFVRFIDKDDAQDALWDVTYYYLDLLAQAVKKHGGRLVIVSYPSSVQVLIGASIDEVGLDHTTPDKTLARFCQKRGIELVTLLGPLTAASKTETVFFPLDRHLTVRGHQLAHDVVAPVVTPVLERAWAEKETARSAAAAPE